MAKRWNYSGDVDLREGGLFWREDGADDYVVAVKVTPCSAAGGPDNLFHIESGSIYLGGNVKAALESCGYEGDVSRAMTVDAVDGYQGLDGPDVTVVQIGRADVDASVNGWNPEPDVILRGNASLRRYVKNTFMR